MTRRPNQISSCGMIHDCIISPEEEPFVKSNAKTVDEYLRALPPDRRAAISAVRAVILANLPEGYEERLY